MAVQTSGRPGGAATFVLVHGAWAGAGRANVSLLRDWKGPFGRTAAALKSDPAWTVYELPCGHDVAIDMPEELATILESRT